MLRASRADTAGWGAGSEGSKADFEVDVKDLNVDKSEARLPRDIEEILFVVDMMFALRVYEGKDNVMDDTRCRTGSLVQPVPTEICFLGGIQISMRCLFLLCV